jgi:hypothetical protein
MPPPVKANAFWKFQIHQKSKALSAPSAFPQSQRRLLQKWWDRRLACHVPAKLFKKLDTLEACPTASGDFCSMVSSCLATLGFGPESRWDLTSEFPEGIRTKPCHQLT